MVRRLRNESSPVVANEGVRLIYLRAKESKLFDDPDLGADSLPKPHNKFTKVLGVTHQTVVTMVPSSPTEVEGRFGF